MLDEEAVRLALAAAAERLGGQFEAVAEIRSSHRSAVFRGQGAAGPVIVKIFDPGSAGEGWVRESAALTVLTRLDQEQPGSTAGLVPRLLGTVESPQMVIMADLGAGASVADALLGSDPDLATAAVTGWASSLGRLHAVTRTSRLDFAAELDRFGGDLPSDVDIMAGMLLDAADALPERAGQLGVAVTPAVTAQVRALGGLLDPTLGALTPADACPDNNIAHSSGTALLDFEGASFRPVAWDLAYLAVPWPTCWCSWQLPPEVVEAGLAVWRQTSSLVSADSASLRREIEIASAGWAFVSVNWFMTRARLDDTPWDSALVTPTRRAALQQRLRQVSTFEIAEVDELIGFARTLGRAMTTAWGEVPLPLAPAYRA